jgi:hypothetical protein
MKPEWSRERFLSGVGVAMLDARSAGDWLAHRV